MAKLKALGADFTYDAALMSYIDGVYTTTDTENKVFNIYYNAE